jgi:curved DNA-binding protein CbpA
MIFREGSCLLAVSNAKSELPAAFLQREGRLTAEQFEASLAETRQSKEHPWDQAARIATLPASHEAPLKSKYIRQIAGILAGLPPADVRFTPGNVTVDAAGAVPGPRLLIDLAAEADILFLKELCPELHPSSRVSVNQKLVDLWTPLPVSPEERGLLTVAQNNSVVSDVYSSSFLGEERVSRLLVSFCLAGFVALEHAEVAERKDHEIKLTPDEKAELESLRTLHSRLAETTYYEWLAISPQASAEQVKKEGAERIERLASPRVERLFLAREHAVLAELSEKLTEALKVLANPAQRKEYNTFVESGHRGSFLGQSKVGREQEALNDGTALLRQGKIEAALDLWEAEIAGLPAPISLIVEYVRATINVGKTSDPAVRGKVTQFLRRGLVIDPKSAPIYEALGEWMEATGQSAKALEAFRRAASFAPHSKPAREGLLRLDSANANRIGLFALHQTFEHLNYYDLLGIAPKAALKEIQAAYRECSRRFHPDRFFKSEDPETAGFANEIYKRMVKAYTTLKNAALRKEYDMELLRNLEALRPPSAGAEAATPEEDLPIPPQTQQGKKFFDMAMIAIRQGNIENAKLNLKLGLQVEPRATALKRKLEELG